MIQTFPALLLGLRNKIGRAPRPVLLILSLLFICFIGYIDYLTGPLLAFSLFYLLPIAFICWIRGRLYGFIASAAAALLWYGVDVLGSRDYPTMIIPVWHALIRFAFFLIIMWLICLVNTLFTRLKYESQNDFLTGLPNTRHFYSLLDNEINRFKRYRQPFTIAYMDLDNFKQVNDQFGHLEGNKLLIHIARIITTVLRSTDIPARIGSDEFVFLFVNTEETQAQAVIKKLQQALTRTARSHNWPVSFSMGVVTYKTVIPSREEIIRTADNLMYRVKELGKNNVLYTVFKSA